MLVALLMMNVVLVQLVLWSNQWIMYAIMIIPNTVHFMYVKLRTSHAFFNPAHLNLRQLQWNLSMTGGTGQSDFMGPNWKDGFGNFGRGTPTWSNLELKHRGQNGDLGDHFVKGFGDSGYPDPLFMSAVAASTSFFFGNAGSMRYPDLAS
eukprot:symbB.v1.2.024252.t1/scaffold2281.1/size83474/5